MVFNIRDFKENGLTLGGARPTLFQVELQNIPAIAGVNNDSFSKLTFTCRAANLPPATVSSIGI